MILTNAATPPGPPPAPPSPGPPGTQGARQKVPGAVSGPEGWQEVALASEDLVGVCGPLGRTEKVLEKQQQKQASISQLISTAG